MPESVYVQGIAVLTGGKGRIAEGIKVFRKNQGSYLLISGVDKSVDIEEIIPIDFLSISELSGRTSFTANSLTISRSIKCSSLKYSLSIVYHLISDAPQVKPDPNAAIKIRSPSFIILFWYYSLDCCSAIFMYCRKSCYIEAIKR